MSIQDAGQQDQVATDVIGRIARTTLIIWSEAWLVDAIPTDLDALSSRIVMSATGVQILLFAGYEPSAQGWRRCNKSSLTLSERIARITPDWKTVGTGGVSYELGVPQDNIPHAHAIRLFDEATSAPYMLRTATTVRAMCRALACIGLHAGDFDDLSRRALSVMMRWSVGSPTASHIPRAPVDGQTASKRNTRSHPPREAYLLALSFDATAACQSVCDCPCPGPTNELLAATAIQFIESRRRKYGQCVRPVVQWEVAAGMLSRGSAACHVGTPGAYENTFTILRKMFDHIETESGASSPAGPLVRTRGASSPAGKGRVPQLFLLCHPDHIPRAMSTWHALMATRATAATERCRWMPALLPGMRPYRLDWPKRPEAEGGLYAYVSTTVHTVGLARIATWYDKCNGYFPDGDPQRWTRQREVWILYDQWARAHSIALQMSASLSQL